MQSNTKVSAKLLEFRQEGTVDGVPVLDAVAVAGPTLPGLLPLVTLILVVDPVAFDEGEG